MTSSTLRGSSRVSSVRMPSLTSPAHSGLAFPPIHELPSSGSGHTALMLCSRLCWTLQRVSSPCVKQSLRCWAQRQQNSYYKFFHSHSLGNLVQSQRLKNYYSHYGEQYVPAKWLRLCPTLCDLMDYSPPGSSVHGILQARVLQWVAMPSSRGSS